MLLTSLAYRVGKGTDALSQRQRDAFDFNHAIRLLSAGQQKVKAAGQVWQFYLRPLLRIVRQRCDPALGQRGAYHPVGAGAVNAGQLSWRHLNQLPGTGQLTPGLVLQADPDAITRLPAVTHRAGIGAVHGQLLTAWQTDIGEKPLVAAQQHRFLQGRRKRDQHVGDQLPNARCRRSTACSRRSSDVV